MPLNLISKWFDKIAKNYDAFSVLQQSVASMLIERLLPMQVSPKKIIDVGCATGFGLLLLEDKFKETDVLGLDISKKMLHYAQKRGKWLRKRQVMCADANDMPIHSASVDMIFCNLLFPYIHDCRKILKEILRILRPGGLLVFSSLGPDSLQEIRRSWANIDDDPHVKTFLDIHDVGDSLLAEGFVEPILEIENFQFNFSDTQKMFAELRGLGFRNEDSQRFSFLTSKRRWQRFLEQLLLLKQNQKIPLTFEIILAHAWKPEQEKVKHKKVRGEISIPISQLKLNKRS